MRRTRLLVPAVLVALTATGCGFSGVQNLKLPGGIADGPHDTKLTVELPDVGTLTANGQVKVGDVAVGTVDSITAQDWHAVAKISVDPKVHLPANAIARVGVNSLLGASYLELAAPTETRPEGTLRSGDTITLDRGEAYPATEQVLSAASVVLNGGGLEQLSTITSELDRAFSGNGMAVRDLLPRLDSFVGALDAQKTQIYGAIESLDRLSTRFARNRSTIADAVDQLGPALATLSTERPKLTAALTSLRRLSDVATPLVESTRADIVGNLRDLVPALRAINKAGDSLVRGLGFAVTFPFAPETVGKACRGDYCNLDLVLDLTNGALVNGFTTKDGLPTLPGFPGIPSLTDVLGLLGLTPPTTGSTGGLGTVLGGLTGSTPKTSGSTADNPLGSLLGGLLGGRTTNGATP